MSEHQFTLTRSPGGIPNAVSRIRLATPSDAPEIARLITLLGHPTSAASVVARWEAWAEDGNSALVAPSGDGTLAGVATLHRMAVLHRPRPVGRITALVVDDALRGQGIGRALVAASEAALTRAGCGWLEITSHGRYAGAHLFYARLGYEQTSLRFAKALAPIPQEQ